MMIIIYFGNKKKKIVFSSVFLHILKNIKMERKKLLKL